MNEKIERIKNIVSFFIEVEPDKIGLDTIIDNTILQGSVKIHMMYGELADNGYKVSNYSNIKTFGELLKVLNIGDVAMEADLEEKDVLLENNFENKGSKDNTNNSLALDSEIYPLNIGVDMLNINKLPKVSDFRESSFYIDNFSLQEIAYCLTKKDPYKSFGGKFAAKEAIVKANNNYKNKKFNEIEILNKANGKPYFDNFSISISHEDDLVIAIASSVDNSIKKNLSISDKPESKNSIEQGSFESNNKINSEKKKTKLNGLFTFSLLLNIILGSYIIYLQFFT